jgi:BirA family biotin operon repressor/biotin-[acetyl-CoA-carboxylase] ligase
MTFDLASVRARLPGRRIDWFETLDSTMTEAARDPEPGRIVVAGHQTAGQGRFGRVWHSPPGEGLYVSIVIPTAPLPVMTLALGLAVRDAVSAAVPGAADLRWPNDLLVNGRKVAGTLVVANCDFKMIAGIGINITQRSFPSDLDTPATSLALEGIHATREDLLVALARAVGACCALHPDEILRRFTAASSYASGRRVRAGEIEGVTCGLDPAGFLRVREDNGTETTILAGGVRGL